MSQPVFDSAKFRQVLGHFPTGVTVITAITDGEPVGMAVGSFASLSLEPALVLFCPGNQSSSWPKIREAGSFCVLADVWHVAPAAITLDAVGLRDFDPKAAIRPGAWGLHPSAGAALGARLGLGAWARPGCHLGPSISAA